MASACSEGHTASAREGNKPRLRQGNLNAEIMLDLQRWPRTSVDDTALKTVEGLRIKLGSNMQIQALEL